MEKTLDKNTITLAIGKDFMQILSFTYLSALEFISNGIFVPSINPPVNNDYTPLEEFFDREHILFYKKKIKFVAHKSGEIKITCDNEKDAKEFYNFLDESFF